jgi:hypothetical protein
LCSPAYKIKEKIGESLASKWTCFKFVINNSITVIVKIKGKLRPLFCKTQTAHWNIDTNIWKNKSVALICEKTMWSLISHCDPCILHWTSVFIYI